MWCCLSIFWGSTWLLETYLFRLPIWIVDFDTETSGESAIASAVTSTALGTLSEHAHLERGVVPASRFPHYGQDVAWSTVNEENWGAVIINPNATRRWRESLASGDSSYDPMDAITVYYNEVRFFQVVDEFVVPLIYQILQTAMATASQEVVSGYLETATAADLTRVAGSVPQALGQLFSYGTHNTRPIHSWAIQAPLEAGLIYYLIFCLHVALFLTRHANHYRRS
ncbi:hypothetical protein YB2330_003400 [Saitoella coloradoensis]